MIAHGGSRSRSSRPAGYLILGAMMALAACGLYLGSWGVIGSVPVALVIIGVGMTLQLPLRLVVLGTVACVAVVKACGSMFRKGRTLRWRILSA